LWPVLDRSDLRYFHYHCCGGRGGGRPGDDYCYLPQTEHGGRWRDRYDEVVNTMLYQYSWTVLLAPLLAFAVIIFVTRVWDLLSRPRVQKVPAHGAETDAINRVPTHGDKSQDDPTGHSLPIGGDPIHPVQHGHL